MKFVARLNFPNREPPVRAYVHEAGLSVYGADPVEGARDYIMEVLDKKQKDINLTKYNFILAAIWGLKDPDRAKLIDFFGFSDISKERWPDNPDVSAWVVKNGVYVPQREITCGDTLILFGKEEEYRRTTKSLEDYMINPPRIEELEHKIRKITISKN